MDKEMVNSFTYGSHRRTLLHKAAEIGDHGICTLLLDHGADINKKDARKQTPLWFAAKKGHADICNLLINKGAFVSTRDATGKTPICTAVEKLFEDVCKILIVNGASYDGSHSFFMLSEKMREKFRLWKAEFGKMSKISKLLHSF